MTVIHLREIKRFINRHTFTYFELKFRSKLSKSSSLLCDSNSSHCVYPPISCDCIRRIEIWAHRHKT